MKEDSTMGHSSPATVDDVSREPGTGTKLRQVLLGIGIGAAVVAAVYLVIGGGGGTASFGTVPGVVPTATSGAGAVEAKEGNLAPDFEYTDSTGRRVRLSDYRGKAVMINFWAAFCPPCRTETPAIEAYYREHRESVVVLGINVGQEGDGTIGNFVQQYGVSYQVLADRTGAVSALYYVDAIPHSVFVDKSGIIRKIQIGSMSKAMLAANFRKALD
ncbi:MAG: TlpA disulfide reductase family protein [Chloroflexota bacterium]